MKRSSLFTQVRPLARRSLVRILRQPALALQGLIFPLFLFAFNSGGLKLATRIPGFPTSSYTTFALALTFTYCGIYAVSAAGSSVGEDIRSGFLTRLSMTKVRSSALVIGQLSGVVLYAMFLAVVFLAVGLAGGAHVEAGVGGALLIVAFAGFYALALGSLGFMAGVLTRSPEAVQGLFPLFMAALFLSSVNLPRELIHSGWFRDVATYNPLSYLVEAPRSLLVTGWDAEPLILGVLVAGSILFGAMLQASVALRTVVGK